MELLKRFAETAVRLVLEKPGEKMRVHDLMLNRLEELGEIPRINSGGCAIVAHRLHEFLTEKGYKPQIIYILDREDLYEFKRGNIVSCAHAIVRVARRYYHAGGEFTDPYYDQYTRVNVEPEYVAKSIADLGNWNRRFNRDFIPDIHEILT